MKMNAKALAPVALVAAFGLGTLAPHAQTTGQKVGFVDVDALFAAHPGDKDVQAIKTKANAELTDLSTKIQAINAKGAAITAADKDNLKTLTDTLTAKQKDYGNQLAAKAAPVEKSVDTAISTYAKANGFSVVMDRAMAQGLVVYADDSTNITEGVKKNVK